MKRLLIFVLLFGIGIGLLIGEFRIRKLREQLKDIHRENENWKDKLMIELKKMWEGDDLK